MTETPDQRRVSEIARSLNRYEWRPTAEEISCGAAFFQLVQRLEEAVHPRFPRDASAKPWTLRLRTENVAVLAEEITLLREEFLPHWRERLAADSPMTELVDLLVRGAQAIVRRADAVLAAWEQANLPEPTAEEIARALVKQSRKQERSSESVSWASGRPTGDSLRRPSSSCSSCPCSLRC